MKTLIKFANANGLKVAKIRYTSHGVTSIGYDLIRPREIKNTTSEEVNTAQFTGDIVVRIEPRSYATSPEKWAVIQSGHTYIKYLKSLREISGIELAPTRYPNIYASNEPFLN